MEKTGKQSEGSLEAPRRRGRVVGDTRTFQRFYVACRRTGRILRTEIDVVVQPRIDQGKELERAGNRDLFNLKQIGVLPTNSARG
jgi:hypothetical protein